GEGGIAGGGAEWGQGRAPGGGAGPPAARGLNGVPAVDSVGVRGAREGASPPARAALLRPPGAQWPPAAALDRIRSRPPAQPWRPHLRPLPRSLPSPHGAVFLSCVDRAAAHRPA